MVNFDDSMTESDESWKEDQRESWESVEDRVQKFLRWLVQQPQDHVAVITHGVYMECLLESTCPGSLEGRRVYNCDAYACECRSAYGLYVSIDNVRPVDTTTADLGHSGRPRYGRPSACVNLED
jgi:broad specificity phosphatase PhoE